MAQSRYTPRTNLAGFNDEQRAAIAAELQALLDEVRGVSARDVEPAIQIDRFVKARAGEHLRLKPPPGGQALVLPPPQLTQLGDTIIVSLEAPEGNLTVRAAPFTRGRVNIENTVNGLERATFSTTTQLVFRSNGDKAWSCQSEVPEESPAGVALASVVAAPFPSDATYLLETADSDLPNGNVADSSAEIEVDFTTPGFVSWRYVEIPDQRVLGNDAGAMGRPTPITVHTELDWIGGGFAWFFDGVNDFVTMGNVRNFERTNQFTLMGWMLLGNPVTNTLIGKVPVGAARGYVLFQLSTGELRFRLRNTVSTNALEVQTTAAFTDLQRHHIAATYDGTSTPAGVKIYVDGVSQTLTTIANTLSATIIDTGSSLVIGASQSGTTSFNEGPIQHVSLWNDDLTAAEVLEAYGGGTPPDLLATSMSGDLLDWWKLDESDVTGAGGINDYGPGGFDGTANFSPTGGLVGGIPTRGTSLWQLISPSTSGLALVTNGAGSVSTYRQLGTNGMPSYAANTFLGNFTGSTDVPQAVAGSTVAGAGLTYTTGGILAVGSSTSINVNANDIQRAALTGFAAASANSNATTSAEPIVTYSASANMSAERVTTSSTSVTVDTGTANQIEFRRAALTGDVTASANSNATTLSDAVVTPTKLAAFGTPTNTGATFAIYVSYAAAAAGTPDDVTVYNGTAPFAFRILEAWQVTSTAIALATVQARTATGGGGSALTTAMAAVVAGKSSDNSTATTTVAASGSVFLRRSDRGVAGETILLCVRT